MNELRSRTAVTLVLQAAALAALLAGLLGAPGWDPHHRPRWMLLVDRSQSMPRADTDAAMAGVQAALHGAQVETLAFAGGVSGVDGAVNDAAQTDLEAALQAALSRDAEGQLAGVAVISDGHETRGDATRALHALRELGLPVHWQALGGAVPPARLGDVLAPARARGAAGFDLSVAVQGDARGSWRVQANARGEGGVQQRVTVEPRDGRAVLHFDAFQGGTVVVDLSLEDVASGAVLDRRRDAAAVELAGAARLLVAEGSAGVYARSLAAGGWPVRVVPAARLGAEADALAGVDAVILDDVAASDAPPRFWQALDRAVRERGIGLVVLGGERAWARGAYRGSPLEALLPLQAEPPGDDTRAAVLFAVDKSGSMGLGSGGVDRFAMALRAVADTVRGLGERDSVGLLAFDVEPRVLLPLGPLAAGRVALERDWPVRPAGGTRLAPALEAAIAQLEQAPVARRWLVLVTDGFTEPAALPALRARLARARIEAVALAVGPDADVAALQRLFGDAPGAVMRVAEAAELPLAMRSGLERRRARVERGEIAVRQVAALPFAPGRWAEWPPVAAHAATRARPGATVVLQSATGEALLAHWTLGRGRVAALATGFGAWSPRWAGWREWPVLAGGLADWAAGADGGPWALAVTGAGAALGVDLDGVGEAAPTLTIDTPAGPGRETLPRAVAPGRWRAMLPDAGPGLYTVRLSTAQGTRHWPVLRRAPDEGALFGTSAALEAWRRAGWVQAWDAQRSPALVRRAAQGPRSPERSWLAAALVLALAGVLCDRAAFLRARWRGWRRWPS